MKWIPHWRAMLVPKIHHHPKHATMPPWQGAHAAQLKSARFEHAGSHHRLQVREHADGSGLVVVDARRIARIDAAGMSRLRAWLSAGALDAAAFEQEAWGESILTGSGPPRAANAWDPHAGAQAVPEIPLVASLECAPSSDAAVVERVRALHALAVPHVIFRPLAEAAASACLAGVRAAEDLGLVAGVAAPADVVDDGTLLEDLAQLGLDHLALTIAGDGAAHDAILGTGEHVKLRRLADRAARLEIALTGELPLLASNWLRADDALIEAQAIGMQGVTAWALVGDGEKLVAPLMLRQVARTLEHAAEQAAVVVTWAAPERVTGDVAAAIARGPRSDGDFGMRVTAAGDVLPPRGGTTSAGRLGEPWSAIRSSASWLAFLEQATKPTRCELCPGLALCAVDCPADEEGWA